MADNSIDLAKNVIVNYKDVTSWILLIILIIISIVNYKKNISLAKTVEKFKSDLTKKEIKFTRHTEMQIECLRNFYELAVTLHFSFINLQVREEINSLKAAITDLNTNFQNLLFFSHRNRILLPEEIAKQYKIVNTKFNTLNSLSKKELSELFWLEERNLNANVESIYDDQKNEKTEVKKIITKLKTNTDVTDLEVEIQKLRRLIEDYFKQLVG
jgi:hypothetical protein